LGLTLSQGKSIGYLILLAFKEKNPARKGAKTKGYKREGGVLRTSAERVRGNKQRAP